MNPDLMALLGQRVTVTHPSGSSTWTGKLLAVGDEPCVAIGQDHGSKLCLPQSYIVTPVDDAPPEPDRSDVFGPVPMSAPCDSFDLDEVED